MSELYVYEEDDPVIENEYNKKEITEMKEIKTNFNKKEKHNDSKTDNFTNLEKECLRLQQIQKLNSSTLRLENF